MQHKTDTRLALYIATLASLGAGTIHLAVAPDHWQEWVPSGMFFIGIALFQLCWAGAVLRFPFSGLPSLAVAANLASMALWGASRLWGFPAGPNAGVPAAVGVPGVIALVLESLVVASVLWFLFPRKRAATFSTVGYRFALGGAALVVVSLTAPATIAALDHDHGGGGGVHGEPGAGSGTGHHDGGQQRTTAPGGPSMSTPSTPAPTTPADGHAEHGEHEH